jgi:hypothetical protein
MSPVAGPPRALDTLLSVLKNKENRFQPEVRANVCALFGQLGRKGVVDEADKQGLQRAMQQIRPFLASVTTQDKDSKGMSVLVAAAERALAAWD